MSARKILLVEGTDDEHVLKHLCGNRGIPRLDEIRPQGSVEKLLENLPVRLKESDVEVLGVVLDADTDVAARWRSLRDRLAQMGHELSEERVEKVFNQFKALADRKKEVFDEDLEAILSQVLDEGSDSRSWELVKLQTTAGTGVVPTATVQLKNLEKDEAVTDAATGDGPIDAAFACIMRLTGIDARLQDFDLRALTGGGDAQGEVHLELLSGGKTYRGRARSTDIVEASALAFLNAINRAIAMSGKEAKKEPGV